MGNRSSDIRKLQHFRVCFGISCPKCFADGCSVRVLLSASKKRKGEGELCMGILLKSTADGRLPWDCVQCNILRVCLGKNMFVIPQEQNMIASLLCKTQANCARAAILEQGKTQCWRMFTNVDNLIKHIDTINSMALSSFTLYTQQPNSVWMSSQHYTTKRAYGSYIWGWGRFNIRIETCKICTTLFYLKDMFWNRSASQNIIRWSPSLRFSDMFIGLPLTYFSD